MLYAGQEKRHTLPSLHLEKQRYDLLQGERYLLLIFHIEMHLGVDKVVCFAPSIDQTELTQSFLAIWQ